MSPGTRQPVILICLSAALTFVVVLLSRGPIAELARAASAYPESPRTVAVDLGALPGMLSSPPHQPALFAAAFVACSLAIAALVLRRRRPGALATLAFAAAGAVLLCLVMLFDLAGQGSDLRLAFDVWRSPQLAAVREAVRELRLLALAMLVPVLLAGAAGILAFARGTRPSESLG